jgi:hypothetical protein
MLPEHGIEDDGCRDKNPIGFTINRALPPWALTTLRKGVADRKPDSRAIFGRFVRLAMSAQRRGWSQAQWTDEMWSVERRLIHGTEVLSCWPLLIQLMTAERGRAARMQRALDRAWATAWDNLFEDDRSRVLEWAWAWEARLDEDTDGLSAAEKRVMLYVTTSIDKRQIPRVTCPCREVAAAAGLDHHYTAYRILKRLTAKGLLHLEDAGCHSTDPAYRKAALYSLANPFITKPLKV